jgi:hypothetical protein
MALSIDTVHAKNIKTGVIHVIDREMLSHPGWKDFVPCDPEGNRQVVAEPPKAPKAEVQPSVVMTAAGTPFKTEAAAKTAMTAKKLSEPEWMIIPVEDGFIIAKG